MWVHSQSLYCDSTKKSMTNIILSLIILCNYGNGKYKLPMYCLYIILHAGIIGLIIFLKPGFEPSPSPMQAHRWAGLGLAWGRVHQENPKMLNHSLNMLKHA